MSNCLNSIPPKHQYKNECVNTCPEINMIVNNENICIKNLFLDNNNNDGNVNITIPIEQTTDWVNLHIVDYLDQNHTIFGDGFILQVYPLNDPLTDYDNVSEVDLIQCEILLKRQYQIPENESLIIVKYDIINSSSITNEVEYSIYDKDGNKLNKKFCDEVKTEIMHPINVNLDINLDYAKEMHIKGIDIYNINDDYFTSLCFFMYNIYKERIKYIIRTKK